MERPKDCDRMPERAIAYMNWSDAERARLQKRVAELEAVADLVLQTSTVYYDESLLIAARTAVRDREKGEKRD